MSDSSVSPSPFQAPAEAAKVRLPLRPLDLAAIAVTGVATSAVLGGLTNTINGAVGPVYFQAIMGWKPPGIWGMAIVQGVFEGVMFGIAFSLLYTVGAGILTGVAARYGFLVRHLGGIALAALGGWAVGGLIALGLATASPAWYQQAFRNVPTEPSSMLQFAWVGGSIWGLEFGGLGAVVIGLVVLRASWVRRRDRLLAERS